MTEKGMDTNIEELIQKGIAAARENRREEAYQLLTRARQQLPHDETILLWIAAVTDNVYEAVQDLEEVLEINPENTAAKDALVWARARQAEVDQLVRGFIDRTHIVDHEEALKPNNVQKTLRRIGDLLVQERTITSLQLTEGLERHQIMLQQGRQLLIGEVLTDLGFITSDQLRQALRTQRQEIDIPGS